MKIKKLQRNRILLVICGLILVLMPTLGCAVDEGAGSAMTAVSATNTRVLALEQWKAQFEVAVNALKPLIDSKADKSAVAAPATPVNTYTKTEMDAKITALEDRINKQEQSFKQWTTGNLPQQPLPPYGTNPSVPTSPSGGVTWITNPVQLPQIFSGVQGITAGTVFAGSTPATLCSFTVQPTGYVQPYTLRVVNNSSTIQYVKPVITLSQATSGGYFYGGQYPQVIYYSLSVSSGMGMVQGTGFSNFYQKTGAGAGYVDPAVTPQAYPTTNQFNNWFPSNYGSFIPGGTGSQWILQGGWWQQSQTNPVATSAAGVVTGACPINLSPSNANIQPTPSITLTTSAPALNGYGEFQMTPGQAIDMLITLQVATLQQVTLQVQTSVSYRQ